MKASDYEGENLSQLVDALRDQKVLRDSHSHLDEVAQALSVRVLQAGETLCSQGDWTKEIWFVISGAGLQVSVDGLPVADRLPTEAVGEMAALEPTKPRSAAVKALGQTIVGTWPHSAFNLFSERHPEVFKQIARVLAERLRERSKFLRPRSARPRVFVGSSSERLDVVRALETRLARASFDLQPWTNGVFVPGSTAIEDLAAATSGFDFAIFVLTPDDELKIRDQTLGAPRDNTVFELGLFMGALGRNRVLGMTPRGGPPMRRLSDFAGVTLLEYESAQELSLAVAPACNTIEQLVKSLGPR